MKVLITGSEGFIGRNLKRYFKSLGYDVAGIDIADSSEYTVDVVDKDAVFRAVTDFNPDAIVHLAAIVSIPKSIEDPYNCYRVNCFGTLNVLEASARIGLKRFIYASSANVYGLPKELPVREDTPISPRAPYDFSKVIGEKFVESYINHKGLPAVILRSWKLFGEDDVPTSAIVRFVRSCLTNQPLYLYNAGRDSTDPTYIENYCLAVKLSLEREEAVGQVFNVGTGNEVTIRQLAEKIKALTGSSSELILLPPRTEMESEPMRSYPSIEKLMSIGYRPVVSLEEGLKRVIEYEKKRVGITK
ncbi:MAG: GDP-mannose 4,6-dehydratase [Nitrososphaerota archaeon]